MAVKQTNTENESESSSSSQGGSKPNNQKKSSDLSEILKMIEYIISEYQGVFPQSKRILICSNLVHKLSKVAIPREPMDLKLFKEDIKKIGKFLEKIGEDNPAEIYWHFFKTACTLIANEENPSYALAIIFQLFSDEAIPKAVSLVLSTNENTSDEIIKKTVTTLCMWLCWCNFCPNLNIWIIAILNGLREQYKFELLYNIAMEVIEPLFRALLFPLLRSKIAPVVFHILSSVKHTPDVFHKIIGKAPQMVNKLRNEKSTSECKEFLQAIVDILSALMAHFQGYDDLYKETVEAISDFTPSYNYQVVLDYPSWGPAESISTNAKVGLVNLGNTCYMNSVLQALAMTKEFSREILLSRCKSPILLKIQQLFALILHSSRPELIPSTVLHASRPPGFVPGLQQDSSEFLGYLLEMLHEQETNSSGSESSNSDSLKVSSDSEDFSEEGATSSCFKKNNYNHSLKPKAGRKTTIIEETFGGKITTTYKCLTCNWQSKNVDTFRDLQLAFPEVKNDCASNYSVQDLLDYYCSPEKLDGENQYFCEKCKKLTDAERFINVVSEPKNLILTLKHFKYDQKYHMRAKLMHKVFHDEDISLKIYSPETLNEIASANYNLYAAVVHSGYSMDSGHYYTYASDTANNWYKFNDNIVTQCDISELHNLNPPNTPYILFYQINSRSTENLLNSAKKVEIPSLPSFEELPSHLREYIIRENFLFEEEARNRKLNMLSQNIKISLSNKDGENDDHDDHDDEPPAACGGNALNYINRFIY